MIDLTTARVHATIQLPTQRIDAAMLRVEFPDHGYGERTFRTDAVSESLLLVAASDGRLGWVYRVDARGPIITKAGNEHRTQRGSRAWGTEFGYKVQELNELPSIWVNVGVLAGEDALRARLREMLGVAK